MHKLYSRVKDRFVSNPLEVGEIHTYTIVKHKVEYKLVEATDARVFEHKMMEALDQGYEPSGDLQVCSLEGKVLYAHSLMRVVAQREDIKNESH